MTLILDKENPLETKVQTRDGRKARLICVDAKGALPLVALVLQPDSGEGIASYHLDGTHPYSHDLINAPVTHKRFVNFSKDKRGVFVGGDYATRREADDWGSPERIACIEIEFKEGDGLYHPR